MAGFISGEVFKSTEELYWPADRGISLDRPEAAAHVQSASKLAGTYEIRFSPSCFSSQPVQRKHRRRLSPHRQPLRPKTAKTEHEKARAFLDKAIEALGGSLSQLTP